ncbi:phage late control gene D protein (GPD) [Providencia rettgeri DSM 1131]|uniref:phage late control D family protein n=1 Tax=Providencia rettgeri TaxID=587 RepID=UPI000197C6A9|nr:phage late control D family protein [Providencia rettgeri]EFE55472.1 phage late control gene D protein (GPD) [Providencia rettgeri DSM 1131]QXA56153.1 phage late control D family protein [Providencia rettgeri]
MSFTDWTEGNLVKVPAFDLTVGGVQLLGVNDQLMSLTLTDNRGFEADTLELTIDDTDGKIALPARGAEISVSLGWQGEALVHKGMYTVDEISHSGPPDQITVTARSADFRQDFNVKREYSWHDIKVPDVISAIAGRYNLKPAVSKQLMHIEIDHADQTNESDISFLTRMAEMLGAIATIKNGSLLFIVPNQGVTQSGKPLPVITIMRESGDRHYFRLADRQAYTGVQAYWLDLNYGQQKKTNLKRKQKPKKEKSSKKEGDYIEGAEGNIFVMRQTFKNEQSAKRAAAAKWLKLQRGVAEFNITLAEGRADLYPEMPVTVTGFKPTIDSHQWVISRVTHTIDGNGFITHLELEIKIKDIDMTDDEQSDG